MKTKQKRTKTVVSVLVLAGLVVFALTAIGGNLEPSAPPGPTMKTLDEVEPRKAVQSLPGDANSLHVINESGSYYLTGNITGQAGKHGIKIDANNVTLDLMGFSLIGVPGSGHGVYDKASPKFMSIGNGTICNWGGNGIDCTETENPYHLQLEELSVHNNGGNGIHIGPKTYTHMEEVSFTYNGGNGIDATDAFLKIKGGNVSNNDANGLVVDGNSCCHLEDVAFTYNAGHGAVVGVYGMLDAFGVLAPYNGGSGIIAGGSGNLNRCTAVGNSSSGMEVGSGSTVKDCTARNNSGDGILVSTNCNVVGNTCESNALGGDVDDAAGIHATGSGNRIEANHVINNDAGIDVDSAGNLIIRNSARGNTNNYDIAENNTVGPVVDESYIGTNNNPHANYEF